MFVCNGDGYRKTRTAASIVDVMTRSELMGKVLFLADRKRIGEAGKGCVL